MIREHINTLLNTRMDRENFIKYVAVGAVALIGGGWLVPYLMNQRSGSSAVNDDYGATVYGGNHHLASTSGGRGTS